MLRPSSPFSHSLIFLSVLLCHLSRSTEDIFVLLVHVTVSIFVKLMETCVDENVLQVAALSQTLLTMRKMKYQDNNPDDSEGSGKEGMSSNETPFQPSDQPSEITLEQIASLKSDVFHEGELRIAVSMLDGVVIYTSGLTQALGYPKEMWIGRSLIDFVHPKHRASFASFIIQSIAELHPNGNSVNGQRNVYFCCLRKYRGFKSGFQVSEQRVNYLPCQITLKFKELTPEGENFMKECLIITAAPIRSAYKYPDETRMSPKFMTRHSVNCQLVHVDPEVTPYFGFLPQDMLNRSILDFHHPEDLHFLKEVYEAVIKEQGHPFRSKPYRFLCQNGGYALVETELSSFINPWTRKLEFIIGQHSVLRGPSNPDVTTPCSDPEPMQISEEVLKETKIVQEEIKCLLNETVVRSTETAKQQVSKRCKDLAAFMENLMDEITKPPDLKVVVPTEEQSFSERDSVMLGEISPHHDYFDCKSISETPPSYNQLNYNENINRFFDSKPKTTVSDESSGSGADNKTGSSGEEGKTSVTVDSSSGSKSGDSGASSGQSTGSNGNSGETTSNDTSNNSNNTGRTANNTEGYKPPALTELLLSRHNEDMEKQMVQKHRVSRTKSDRDSKVKDRLKSIEKGQDIINFNVDETGPGTASQGIKRSGSHSWESEPYKTIKASHVPMPQHPLHLDVQPANSEPPMPTIQVGPTSTAPGPSVPLVVPPPLVPPPSTSNLWTYPLGSPALPSCPPPQEFPRAAASTNTLMPMYYIPNQRANEGINPPTNAASVNYPQPFQFVPSMLYHPFMYGTPPLQVYSPIVYPPTYSLNSAPRVRALNSTQIDVNTEPTVSCGDFQQLPSVKGEPENPPVPRTVRPLPTGSQFQNPSSASGPSMSTLQKSSDNEGGSQYISTPYDDSSYQSSFYSFLRTDKSDESMKSSSENGKVEEHGWGTKKDGKNRPIRKVAPWIENVNVTPDLMLKYQMHERGLEETLKTDAVALEKLKQSNLVNDQLSQMYLDLEMEGLPQSLVLEEGVTSSSDSSGDDTKGPKYPTNTGNSKRRKRYMEYDKMTILFEEDAPMPPPITAQCT